MFPQVAEIMRCPSEILSAGAGAVGAGTDAVLAVAAMIVESSNCAVHDASGAVSGWIVNPTSGVPGWAEVEKSNPVGIRSGVTDPRKQRLVIQTRAVDGGGGEEERKKWVRTGAKRKIFGFGGWRR